MKDEAETIIQKIIIVAIILVALISIVPPVKPTINEVHGLTDKQMQSLVYQLGFDGYKIALNTNCIGVIASRLNTGKWSDDVCQFNYQHIKFEEL